MGDKGGIATLYSTRNIKIGTLFGMYKYVIRPLHYQFTRKYIIIERTAITFLGRVPFFLLVDIKGELK